MAEYINRDATIKAIHDVYEYGFPTASGAFDDFATKIVPSLLNSIPAADVVSVVHGRWEYNPPTINTYGQLRCSICNWWTLDPSVDRSYSYCPNCGAKMDGGAE